MRAGTWRTSPAIALPTRAIISLAARRENVSRRMREGSAPFATKCATRHDNVFITPEQKDAAELACVRCGLEALHLLDAMEASRGASPIWHPGLPLKR